MSAALSLQHSPNLDAWLADAPMSPQESEAVELLHTQFSRLDISVVSEASQAAAHLLAALPVLSPYEDTLRRFAVELGQEVARHPEANLSHLFQLHLQSLEPENAAQVGPENSAGKVTRLVTLPVADATSLRGNITAPNLHALYDQYHAGQALFLFTAYPVELETPDQDRLNRLLSDQQARKMLAVQAKMLFQAMAAASENFEARTALVGVLSQLRTLGTQLNSFRAAAEKRAAPAELLQASQAIRQTGSALAGEITKSVLLNPGLPPQLRETMRAGLQQIQTAGGVNPVVSPLPRVETVARTTPLVAPVMPKRDAAAAAPNVQKTVSSVPPSLAVNRSAFVPQNRPQVETTARTSLQAVPNLVKSDLAVKTPAVPNNTAANPVSSVAAASRSAIAPQTSLPSVTPAAGRYASIIPVQITITPPQNIVRSVTAPIATIHAAPVSPMVDRGVSAVASAVAAPAASVIQAAPSQTIPAQMDQAPPVPTNNVLPFVGRTEIPLTENSAPVLQVAQPVTGVGANNVVVLDIANRVGVPLEVERPAVSVQAMPVSMRNEAQIPVAKAAESTVLAAATRVEPDHTHHHGHEHGHSHTHTHTHAHTHGPAEDHSAKAFSYSPPEAPVSKDALHLPPAPEKTELPPVAREEPVRVKEGVLPAKEVSETPYVPPKAPERTEKTAPAEPAVATVGKSENIAQVKAPEGKAEYEPPVKNRDAEVKAKIPEGPPCGGCGRADCPYCGGGARVAAKTVRAVGPQLTLSRR
jgi:hypothetical protein